MVGFVEKRQPENGAGRRCTDGYCPLHLTHHADIKTLKDDVKGLEKGKVGMKLFGILIGSATIVAVFVGGWMISSQREIAKDLVEVKTDQARIATQVEIYMTASDHRFDNNKGQGFHPRDR
jgi:hypothetical protein